MPAPASHRFCDTVNSYSGVKPSRMWLAAVDATPLVQNRSFIPIGTPASGLSVLARGARIVGGLGGGERVVGGFDQERVERLGLGDLRVERSRDVGARRRCPRGRRRGCRGRRDR